MYRLIYFGSQSLEQFNQIDDIGSGSTPTNYVPLIEGGAYDLFGGAQKHPGVVERSVSRRLQMPSEAALTAMYFALLQLRGQRQKLYRRLATGEIHWIYARLVQIDAKRDYQLTKFKSLQDIDIRFITQQAFWSGAFGGSWKLDDGQYLDDGLYFDSNQAYALGSSPTVLTVPVGGTADVGRAPIRALTITISAGASAMSNITIARAGGESLTFSGTINANKQLSIDTGKMQVLNDGVDAYNNLVFSSTADMAAWFTLLPGDNQVTISFTGGGTGKQVDFSFYEAWY